ncbi:3-oxoacyl-[acyl-carrier-protein] synthase II [Thermosulfidibacter takaii ABI70S6]|uniref:Nodulation protein E n=2 Tax=Thermosulfidibacter takaii TaxID=412593 RepID=A0A0S3QTV2_THET7|nr:3-oxoacyl-[acyl-carrier-protein] synthase II [Thermosulfidibacter takaii ABI70S6]
MNGCQCLTAYKRMIKRETMFTVIVEGKYFAPEHFDNTEGLPVAYYGKINWEEYVQEPKKRWKHFKRLPDVLKVLTNLLDRLSKPELLAKYRVAIVASAKLEKERDLVALKSKDPKKIIPSDGYIFTHNAINLVTAQYLGIEGYYGLGIDHVCSSGLDVLGLGHKLILDGEVDVALAVTINSMATPSRTAYHYNLGVVSKHGKIRPFDRQRDGTIFADGMAVAVLCSEKVAEKENINPLALIKGYGAFSDAYHMFSMRENGRGFIESIKKAVVNDIPHIVKAHATGTKVNDAIEAKVYRELFEDKPLVTALKPIFGHSVTSSGLVETLYLIDCLREEFVPEIQNLEEVDPECEGLKFVKERIPFSHGKVLSVAAGFGGFFSALLLEV